jgi:hypothetical protein
MKFLLATLLLLPVYANANCNSTCARVEKDRLVVLTLKCTGGMQVNRVTREYDKCVNGILFKKMCPTPPNAVPRTVKYACAECSRDQKGMCLDLGPKI